MARAIPLPPRAKPPKVRFVACLVAQPADVVFSLHSSKDRISETDFFDVATTHNDQVSHVTHVLDPLCVFSPFGHGCLPKGLVHKLRMRFLPSLKNRN